MRISLLTTTIAIILIQTQIALAQEKTIASRADKIEITPPGAEYPEIAPVLRDDGLVLYFCKIDHPKNAGGEYDCDIWTSGPGSTAISQHVMGMLNNNLVNAVIKTEDNGNTLYVEGTYNSDGTALLKDGISVTRRDANGKWTTPQALKISNFQNYNDHATYCFDSGMNVLIMSVERFGGMGKLDLYVSFRNSDGTYTSPRNLGATINTALGEGTPYLADDGITLYFSSYGHQGLGNSDIYMARRLDDSWKNWTAPINLGPKINSKFWDAYLHMTSDGQTAYMVSCNNDMLLEKIYKVTVPEHLRPLRTFVINGKTKPLMKGRAIELENVFFQKGSVNFSKDSYASLNDLRSAMEKFPSIKIQINGYTSEGGESQILQNLSEMRALKVKSYLTDHGISGSRITCKGCGSLQAKGNNEADRTKDRRVEFVITEL